MSTGILEGIEENGIDGRHVLKNIQELYEILSVTLQ